MQNNLILWSAENALRNGEPVKMDLKNGERKKVKILNILNDSYLIIKERKFLIASFAVIELQEIASIEALVF
jgi:hypothetical protein